MEARKEQSHANSRRCLEAFLLTSLASGGFTRYCNADGLAALEIGAERRGQGTLDVAQRKRGGEQESCEEGRDGRGGSTDTTLLTFLVNLKVGAGKMRRSVES